MSKFTWAACVAPLFLAASLASADVRVYLRTGPPRTIVERRPPAPGRGYTWIAGFHRWNGSSYEWVSGRWEAPPRRHSRWRKGGWHRDRRHGWYWIEGGWR